MESSKKDLLKGSSWILFGNLFSKILVFCATIAVTHILTKDLYGQLGIIRSTVQMFIAVSSFGIAQLQRNILQNTGIKMQGMQLEYIG